jgi:hypothetical protein
MKKYPYEIDGFLKQGHRTVTFHTITRDISEEMAKRYMLISFPNLVILRVRNLEENK